MEKKGGVKISLDNFREQLGIDSKYKYYNDIKRQILIPVQEELFEKADCWFNCNAEDFTTKHGNTATHLNFKVITPDLIKEDIEKKDYVFYLLRTHFKFEDKHIELIKPLFINATATDILLKIMQLTEHKLKDTYRVEDILVAVRRAQSYKVFDSGAIERFLTNNSEPRYSIKLSFKRNNNHDHER